MKNIFSIFKKKPLIIKYKKLNGAAVEPKRGHYGDAGFDLVATHVERLDENRVLIHTGIAVEIPYGYQGTLRSRSRVHKTGAWLSSGTSTIDAGYRGEIKAIFYHKGENLPFEVGERFGQLIISPVPEVRYVESEELSESERGTGGYGSTGTK